jgi:hypothetical protein
VRYWEFLTESWAGVRALTRPEAIVVVRVGGKRFSANEIEAGVLTSLRSGFGRQADLLEFRSSEIVGSQIRSFQAGESAAGKSREFDIVVRLRQSMTAVSPRAARRQPMAV